MSFLSERGYARYRAHLNGSSTALTAGGDAPAAAGPSAFAGIIGIRPDILGRAIRIADVFRRACRALHATFNTPPETLLKPFDNLPAVRSAVLSSPFCLTYFRMDFFLDADSPEAPLKIMEVNSGGAGLTDYLRCIRHLRRHRNFDPPGGYRRIDVPDVLRSLLAFAAGMHPLKTLGFVAVENGSADALPEEMEYAKWLTENSNVAPVLLQINDGMLSLLDRSECPNPIKNLQDLDAVFFDWFEDPPALERVTRQIAKCGIRTIPAQSDLLFEQKRFLAYLRTCRKPDALTGEEWSLLRGALLPSFPLEEFREHAEEMEEWPGFVLKMDLDCASENVFVYDFRNTSFASAIAALERTLARGHPAPKPRNQNAPKPAWTVQRFLRPPSLPIPGPMPEWIGRDYARCKFDLMTYLCYGGEGKPGVLFGSRGFSREKYDELTEEGREDALWGPVCAL